MKHFLAIVIATIIGRLIVDIAKSGFANTTPSDNVPISSPRSTTLPKSILPTLGSDLSPSSN